MWTLASRPWALRMYVTVAVTLDYSFSHAPTLTQLTTIRFANRSLKSHSWSIQRRSTKVMMHPKFDHQNVLEYFSADDIEQTLQVLPTEGVLNGHCAQALEISFKPSIPFCETVHHLALVIDGLSEYPITARGYGATTSICCAVDVVQFGAVRVGLEKICTLPLMNNGALPVRYYAESNDSQVTVWPEAGIIDGHGKVQLKVRYMPSRACETHANIWITPFSEEPYILVPVTIPVTGSANYPKIELLTKDVDFGRALLQFDNVRQITVENRGLVDAILKLQSSHPCIRLEPDCVTLLPKSRHEVNIVYNPTAVEKLLSKAIIQSADGRGEKFVIALRGDVGIPKLVLYPLDSLKHLDFGVCKINELTTKTMTLVNEGNIDITFQFIIQRGPAVDKEVFSIEPQTGLLGVGDKCDVKFHFRPKAMKENAVRVTLDYKFGSTKGVIVGTGGKSVVTVDMLQPVMDFGLCRMGRVYTKELVLKNHGNLASTFRLRPEPALGDDASKATDPENGDVVPQWQSDLHGMGVEILNADGYCPSLGVTVIRVAFKPVTDKPISQRFRLFFNDNDYMDFDLLAAGSVPRLELSDNELSLGKHKETRVGGAAAKSGAITVPKKDLGTHPVATEHVTIVYLRNPGMLGIDFLIQPFGMDEFEVSPRRGFIEPGMSIPLKVYFRPLAEFHYQVVLKVLWELEPLVMQLSAHGGVGRLLIEFSEEKDMYSKCMRR